LLKCFFSHSHMHHWSSPILTRWLGTWVGKWVGFYHTGGACLFKSWNMPPLNKTGDWGSSDDCTRFTWMWCALPSLHLLPSPTVSGCLLLQVPFDKILYFRVS
jgi:hypothetical protein